VTPDLDRHFARVNDSAPKLGLKALVTVDTWLGLARDGIKRFGPKPELYIRPMYWAESGNAQSVPADPDSTRWCLTMYDTPMPVPGQSSITLSPFRRPSIDTMPVDAKAGCLYPNNARALAEAAHRRGSTIACADLLGTWWLGTANIFMAKGGVVHTPIANGTFLNGITRQRVIGFSRTGVECASVLSYPDFLQADEMQVAAITPRCHRSLGSKSARGPRPLLSQGARAVLVCARLAGRRAHRAHRHGRRRSHILARGQPRAAGSAPGPIPPAPGARATGPRPTTSPRSD
jgi:branched-subunit amino acid aminotransferase/4-amino-4-deoxychorismate lyase